MQFICSSANHCFCLNFVLKSPQVFEVCGIVDCVVVCCATMPCWFLFIRQAHPRLNSLSFASSSLVNHLKFYFMATLFFRPNWHSVTIALPAFVRHFHWVRLSLHCLWLCALFRSSPARTQGGRAVCFPSPPQQVHSTPSMMRLLADAPAKGWRVVGATLSPQAVTLPQLPTGVPAGGVVWVFIVFAG